MSGEFEFASATTTGDVMEFYWAPSPEIVAAYGNPMSINGVDAISPSGFSTLAELVAVCQFIVVFVCLLLFRVGPLIFLLEVVLLLQLRLV